MITPWYVGQTLPNLTVTFQTDTLAPQPLTNLTPSLVIRNPVTGVDMAGAGTWSIANAAAGIAQYTWASADVAVAGSYVLVITLTDGSGRTLKCDPIPWQVVAT